MKDTLRLLVTLKCNLNCSYCCNKQSKFNSKFTYKTLDEINFSDYNNLCITGGEPFIGQEVKELVRHIIVKASYRGAWNQHIPIKNFYIYSNGLLINESDLYTLHFLQSVLSLNICLNIGLHSYEQLYYINSKVGRIIPARFMFEKSMKDKMFKLHKDRLNEHNTKTYTLNECDMPNEDWVVLKGNI